MVIIEWDHANYVAFGVFNLQRVLGHVMLGLCQIILT